jgi:hypothetical protein
MASILVKQQWMFLRHVSMLIECAARQGFILTGGELYRPQEMQEIYVKQGKSKTRTSNHTRRLAIDFNVFVNDKLATLDEIRPLGKFWEGLDPLNRWGGNFSTIKDGPHFERHFW